MQGSKLVERTVAQPDGAVLFVPWFEAVPGERHLQRRAWANTGSTLGRQAGAVLPRRIVKSSSAATDGVAFHGHRE